MSMYYRRLGWVWANGCNSNNNCTGKQVYIEKNNSNILGPGPVNLVDVEFDKVASSFQCF
jgi:hypothetical protein